MLELKHNALQYNVVERSDDFLLLNLKEICRVFAVSLCDGLQLRIPHSHEELPHRTVVEVRTRLKKESASRSRLVLLVWLLLEERQRAR